MSVDESTVIFGPICQVGCARASATLTEARSAADLPRNGPPLAVSTSLETASGPTAGEALVNRAVLGVDR